MDDRIVQQRRGMALLPPFKKLPVIAGYNNDAIPCISLLAALAVANFEARD